MSVLIFWSVYKQRNAINHLTNFYVNLYTFWQLLCKPSLYLCENVRRLFGEKNLLKSFFSNITYSLSVVSFLKAWLSCQCVHVTRYFVLRRVHTYFPFWTFFLSKWSFTKTFAFFGLTKQAHNGWFYFSKCKLVHEVRCDTYRRSSFLL